MSGPPKSLTDLPARIQRKVQLNPPDASEHTACWIWTGSFTAARQRLLRQRIPDDGRDRGYVQRDPNLVVQRRLPTCHCTELGYAAATHRVLFALSHDMPIRAVPKLERCMVDECVSPWHVRPMGVVWRPEELAVEPVPGSPVWERCLKLLRAADDGEGVSPNITRAMAADEAGIPQDQLTDAIWAEYVRTAPPED